MPNLLFLCHRIPYPPNKGDKIRSFHFLRALAKRYLISLATFVDDPNDAQYLSALAPYCARICAVPLHPTFRRLRSLRGLLSGKALSVEFYDHPEIWNWLRREVVQNPPDAVFVYSSPMAQYLSVVDDTACRVIDFVDVDSEKWRAYAAAKPWPTKLIYQLEAERLGRFERSWVKSSTHCVLVSKAEAQLFNSLLDVPSKNVSYVDNGVDLDYFSPDAHLLNPFPRDRNIIVFTGAMDYWANVDAVTWFAREIFPQVRATLSASEFWIVGSRPTQSTQRLGAIEGVTVTGRVDDIRPYLQHAGIAVAPMRIARGVQNKVLEAMAMAKPVIGTTAAFEGLHLPEAYGAVTSDGVPEFARLCVEALSESSISHFGASGREYVERHHSWARSTEKLLSLLNVPTHE